MNGFTPALIPAFSPGEKENRSPVFWNVVSRRLSDARGATGKRATAVPSPWGEGKGEGGRFTQICFRCDSRAHGLRAYSERRHFCRLSLNVRPMAMASPTLFICVVSVNGGRAQAPCGNFSKAKRAPTPVGVGDDVINARLEARGGFARDVVLEFVEQVADGEFGEIKFRNRRRGLTGLTSPP